MSLYDGDPRVTDLRTGQYVVELANGGLVDIERGVWQGRPCFMRYPRKGATVGWPDDGIPECDRNLLIYWTADEAIRSLIGDPQ